MISGKILSVKNILTVAVMALVMNTGAASAAEHSGSGGEGAGKPGFEYYQVPPVTVPVVTDKGLTQQVSLAISIELPTGKKDAIAVYGPRLVDAYLSDLFGALGNGQVMMRGNLVDIEALKQRLTTVTTKVLGPDNKENVKAVLLQAVQQNRLL